MENEEDTGMDANDDKWDYFEIPVKLRVSSSKERLLAFSQRCFNFSKYYAPDCTPLSYTASDTAVKTSHKADSEGF